MKKHRPRRLATATGVTGYEHPTADQVRTLRELMGWSRKNMGSELGVSPRTIECWELGSRIMPTPTWRLMLMLADSRALDEFFTPFG